MKVLALIIVSLLTFNVFAEDEISGSGFAASMIGESATDCPAKRSEGSAFRKKNNDLLVDALPTQEKPDEVRSVSK